MPKEWLFPVVIFLLFIYFPIDSLAKVYINEISPFSNPEWVEFYNPDQQDLTGYWIDDDLSFDNDDGNGKIKEIQELKGDNPIYPYVEWQGYFLNNSGDYVVLFDSQGNKVDDHEYGPNSGFIARSPDGSENWVVFDSPSQGEANSVAPTSTPTLTPSPSPTPSAAVPTPSPEPTATSAPAAKAVYRINEVKNEDGETISQVKIYVDGTYVRHLAPETLEFCDGCYCDKDKNVACGFGEHTIRLEKNGYQSWSETKTISSGDSYQAYPHLVLILPTVSPVPTLIPTPTLTPTPTTTLTPTASSSGQLVFGNEATGEGEVKGERDVSPASGSAKNGRLDLAGLPLIFIGGGTIMVGVYFWLEKKGEGFSDETEIKNNKF